MGTRNLTTVIMDGEVKVAQYGQWDGYPSGQGVDALSFLSNNEKVKKLKENLKKVRFIDFEGKDKEFTEAYDKNCPDWSSDPDSRTPEQLHWYKSYIDRDLGAGILESIANSTDEEILLKNSQTFATDGLFCEWVWVIDFDKGTFRADGTDSPSFNLDSLPTEEEFLAAFVDEDDE